MPGGWGGFARGWTKSDEDDPDVFTYPDKLLHELFYEQAAKTPDSVAVVDGDRSLTYAELADQARTPLDIVSSFHEGLSREHRAVDVSQLRSPWGHAG